MEDKHIDDIFCEDCHRYVCNAVLNHPDKKHSCPCDCHKEDSNITQEKKK